MDQLSLVGMTTVEVQYAKTHLSALLTAVEKGEEVVIARGDQPVARLVPVQAHSERELGFISDDVPPEFFDDLPEIEVHAWEGSAPHLIEAPRAPSSEPGGQPRG